MRIRIGSRGSILALTQTNAVAESLRALGHDPEVIVIQTAGDRDARNSFSEIGAPGVFVREIEASLMDAEIDIAVHSYKDLPSQSPNGLVIAAVPERLDPADRLIARPEAVVGADAVVSGSAGTVVAKPEATAGAEVGGEPVMRMSLPLVAGTAVGTGSERRRAWLRSVRPDLELLPIRGNVPTRVEKLRRGPFDAIILAAAGMTRLDRASPRAALDLDGLINIRLDPVAFIPAPSQGAIALQCREADPVEEVLGALHDPSAAEPVRAERQLLRLVDGGCSLPFGAWCRVLDDGDLELIAALESNDQVVRVQQRGNDAAVLAEEVWRLLSDKLAGSHPAGHGSARCDGAGG